RHHTSRDISPFPTRRSSDLGSVIGSVVSLYVALNMRPPVGPAQGAPFVNVLQSVAYAPLMFVGLFVSALVIHAGTGMMRTRPGEDRKSTRLNSSHEWRSYAV